MMDYSTLVNNAKRSTRIIAVIYALLKIVAYAAIGSENLWVRIVGGIILVAVVFIVTDDKLNLSKRQLAVFLPIFGAFMEIILTIMSDGDRLIYFFLTGCALLSLLYIDVIGLLIAQISITAMISVTIMFTSGISLMGPKYGVDDDIFGMLGMMMMHIIIFLLGKYSIESFHRSHQTGKIFGTIIENTPSFMIITNEKTTVTHISASLLKWLELDDKIYAEGRPLLDLFSSFEMKKMFYDVMSCDGFVERELELNINDKKRWFIMRSELLGGGCARFFDFVDITPLVEARIASENANKSKTDFLATMSHEIRTPLNAILGISQIQLRQKQIPAEYAGAFKNIYNSGSNLLVIINDILDMSKIETGKLELNLTEYSVPRLINDAVQMNVVRIGSKSIKFIIEAEENLPSKLYGDEIRIKQILNNLLSNAFKYTEKGYVKLSVRHTLKDNETELHFIVEDTGQGIKPEDMQRLFNEDYIRLNIETNYSIEGTGLGLTISKRLTNMMGGNISVQSKYGEGSTFLLTLRQGTVECSPIGAETAVQLRDLKLNTAESTNEDLIIQKTVMGASVLIVDDLHTNLYVAEELLSPYEMNIETAMSGFEAIDNIKEGSVYDIIFMDHMMPGMDGIETTKELRALGYNKAIVAMTANAMAGTSEMFAANGFDGYISKPIDVRLLDEIIKKFAPQ